MKTHYYNCQFHLLSACFITRSVKLTNMADDTPKLSHMPSYFVAFMTKKFTLRQKQRA